MTGSAPPCDADSDELTEGVAASGWFKIEAPYTEIGATNQIAVTVSDAGAVAA